MDVIKKYSIVEQIGLTLDMYFPRVGLFIAILTYVLTGNNVDAEKVFMTTAFYTILRDSMTTGFAISKLPFDHPIFSKTFVSLTRRFGCRL